MTLMFRILYVFGSNPGCVLEPKSSIPIRYVVNLKNGLEARVDFRESLLTQLA